MNRSKDWLNQALEDVKAATSSMENQHYEWACFQAQQSAEKALKALLLFMNVDAWGHGLIHLLKEWKKIKDKVEEEKETSEKDEENDTKFQELIEKCQELDRHYVQPRYPNGFASGYPAEYYNKKNATLCINYAKNIIDFVEKEIKKISSSE